jgi:hypothetical protein
MQRLIKKIKFLVFCWYKGHRFGVTKYLVNGEITTCARCGFSKKRKFPKRLEQEEYFIC